MATYCSSSVCYLCFRGVLGSYQSDSHCFLGKDIIPNMAVLVLNMNRGLRTADCGLDVKHRQRYKTRATDCGLCKKYGLGYKMWTKADCVYFWLKTTPFLHFFCIKNSHLDSWTNWTIILSVYLNQESWKLQAHDNIIEL